MQKKKCFYSELSYVAGLLVLAFGTALMEKANFGMSMIVAPAYIIHLKVSQYLPFYTFGMSGYVFQALLLCILALITRKFKNSYLFSFVTAVIYGFILDAVIGLAEFLPSGGTVLKITYYIVGLVTCAAGVALLFHTYLPPEAYDLFVKEITEKYKGPLSRIKTVYDVCCCVLSIAMSFAFFGFGVFVGVSWGTVVCTVLTGWLIGKISGWLENTFDFRDALPLREKMS